MTTDAMAEARTKAYGEFVRAVHRVMEASHINPVNMPRPYDETVLLSQQQQQLQLQQQEQQEQQLPPQPLPFAFDDQWTWVTYAALGLGVFLLAFLAEALKATHRVQDAVCAQEALDHAPMHSPARMRFWLKVRYPWSEQIIRTLEHTLKLGIRFLCFYICFLTPGRIAFLSMLGGTAAGYFLLRRMQPPPVTVSVTSSANTTTDLFQWAAAAPSDAPLTLDKVAISEYDGNDTCLHVDDAAMPMGTWHVCTAPDQFV